MKIHCFQHHASEGLGQIEEWVRSRGHSVSFTHFYQGQRPPPLTDVDWLIIMGGAMNIYEYRNHPWLVEEQAFLAEAIAAGKAVLGICLGAQLIANAVGGKVFQNRELEIGWFPVYFDSAAQSLAPFAGFPPKLTPLHWHGDTFSLPPSAVNVAHSSQCQHQAFCVGDKIVGLQFHLEVGEKEVAAFLEGEPGELTGGAWVQRKAEIQFQAQEHLKEARVALFTLLDAIEAAISGS